MFPLLVKRRLADLGRLVMDPYDQIRRCHLEDYLVVDPFAFKEDARAEEHWPWREVESNARMLAVSPRFKESMRVVLEQLPHDA